MRIAIILLALFVLIALPANAQENTRVAGDWQGALQVGGASLKIVFHIERGDDGQLTAKLDSPDQGAFGIPVGTTTFLDDALTLRLPALMASYEGTLSIDGLRLIGTWSQGGQSFPLAMEKADAIQGPNRPQEPHPPYAYRVEEVTIETPTAGVTLAGTLTLPEGSGPHPGVVLISGSGPQDRNEELFGHKPFLVLADHLTRNGIAVLRYDDRGVGGSTGDIAQATSLDFATDARAAFDFLARHAGIDARNVGLIGHSEGGLIAPIVAGDDARVAFIVMLAGPGIPGDSLLALQTKALLQAAGVGGPLVEKSLAFNRGLYRIIRTTDDPAQLKERASAYYEEQYAALSPLDRQMMGLSPERKEGLLQQLTSPWMRTFITYDPAPALARLTIPILSLIGERDMQVPAEPNTRAIEAAFRQAGNTRGKTMILPSLNHLFQTATTGSITEYGQIEETFSPAALDAVTSWIRETTERN
ncbi:MAG: alpha/beta fold hydrolase [Rhodothermales bacterium]